MGEYKKHDDIIILTLLCFRWHFASNDVFSPYSKSGMNISIGLDYLYANFWRALTAVKQ